MSFEVLDFFFMFDGGGAGVEGAQISAFAGFGVDATGIDAIFAGRKFTNHRFASQVVFCLANRWFFG